MQNKEQIKRQAGEALLRTAYLRGHIPEDVYLDRNALMSWWDSLDEQRKSEILEDCATYIKAEDEWQRREEWHKNKFKTPSWRAGLAGTIPAVFAIRWLVYAPGGQKWWAIAIFLGGGILMRLLINLYDKLRGNPRQLSEVSKLKGEKREQSLLRILDVAIIGIGIALIIYAAINSNLVMLIIGIILAVVGLAMLFFRTRYVKRI